MAPGVISPPKIGSDSLVTKVSSVAIIREIWKRTKKKNHPFENIFKKEDVSDWQNLMFSIFRTNISSAKIHKIWSMAYKPYDISVLHL